ncbi:MAG: ABC transporter ATP-binding protein [bacterium]|nr:ABC transporter ATP-binding protein [bacterium]
MHLKINKIGKHYNQQWLFRNISFDLAGGDKIAILGRNGTGKSTLLQIIYGLIEPAEGDIELNNEFIAQPHLLFNYTSPLMVLPLEFTIHEIHAHQTQVGKMKLPIEFFLDYAAFTMKQSTQPIQFFSSGMLQRLKTALCLGGNGKIKLLDEPLSNMDKEGEKWYLNCMDKLNPEDILIVASNDASEYHTIENHITL